MQVRFDLMALKMQSSKFNETFLLDLNEWISDLWQARNELHQRISFFSSTRLGEFSSVGIK